MHPSVVEELADVQGGSLTSLKDCGEHRRLSFVTPFQKRPKGQSRELQAGQTYLSPWKIVE